MLLDCAFLFLPFEQQSCWRVWFFSQTAPHSLERGALIWACINKHRSIVDELGHKFLKSWEFNYQVRLDWNGVQGIMGNKWSPNCSLFKTSHRQSARLSCCSFLKCFFADGWSTPGLNGLTKVIEMFDRSTKTSSLFLVLFFPFGWPQIDYDSL